MPYNPDIHHRRSLRLPGYDYAAPGIYFVTICTAARRCLFDDPIVLAIAEEQWRALERRFTYVALDTWIVMPNHVHGLVQLHPAVAPGEGPRRGMEATSNRAPAGLGIHVVAGSLGAVIRAYKAAVSRRVARLRHPPELPVWQRGYWDRVVRDAEELDAIRRYIAANPQRWVEDRDNLEALLARMVAPPTKD